MTVRFQFDLSDEDANTLINVMIDYLREKEMPESNAKCQGYSTFELEAIKRQGKHFRENIYNIIMDGNTKVTQ